MKKTTRPLTTLKHTCGDAAQTLDDVTGFVAQTTIGVLKRNVTGVTVTCETNDIRFSFTATPTQDGGTAVGHVLEAGCSMILEGPRFVTGFTFINKVNGSNAILQITPEINL